MMRVDGLPDGDQLAVGTVVLVGNHLWKQASWYLRLRIWLCGRRQDLTHLGASCRVHWWRDQPFLVSIREAV